MSSFPHLQSVLGTNRKSPVFTVSQHTETKRYHVSYGMELFDVVPSDREDIRFKLMVGHLANVGVNLSALHNAFGVEGLNALQSALGPRDLPVCQWLAPGTRPLEAGQTGARSARLAREQKIVLSDQRLDALNEKLKTTAREVSRLDTLIAHGAVRLCGEKKYLMDVIKITARNLFYELLGPLQGGL